MKTKKKKRKSFQLKETLSQSLAKTLSSWICSTCKTINGTRDYCCKSCNTTTNNSNDDDDYSDEQINAILKELHEEKVSNNDINLIKIQLNDQAYDYESFVDDLSDRNESWLIDFFRDVVDDITIFDKLNLIIKRRQHHQINTNKSSNLIAGNTLHTSLSNVNSKTTTKLPPPSTPPANKYNELNASKSNVKQKLINVNSITSSNVKELHSGIDINGPGNIKWKRKKD